MLRSSSDDRIDRLHSLTKTLDDANNRRDKASMMSQLSQEFVIHTEKAEKCVKDKDFVINDMHPESASHGDDVLQYFSPKEGEVVIDVE